MSAIYQRAKQDVHKKSITNKNHLTNHNYKHSHQNIKNKKIKSISHKQNNNNNFNVLNNKIKQLIHNKSNDFSSSFTSLYINRINQIIINIIKNNVYKKQDQKMVKDLMKSINPPINDIFDVMIRKRTIRIDILDLFKWENYKITLSDVIKSFIQLLPHDPWNQKEEKFAISMITYFIERGTLCDENQTPNNTFSLLVQTKNINLIILVLESKPYLKPVNILTGYQYYDDFYHNHYYDDFYHNHYYHLFDANLCENCQTVATLNHAIKTMNHNIINIVLDHVAKPIIGNHDGSYNSLIEAIKTHDPEIVFQIIAHGGAGVFDNYSGWNSYQNFYSSNAKYYWFLNGYDYTEMKKEILNRIINLVLCSGTNIEYDSTSDQFDKTKINICSSIYNINNEKIKTTQRYFDELINELSSTMNELIERPKDRSRIIGTLNQELPMMSSPLINIIQEYQWLESSVGFIDWKNLLTRSVEICS